MSATMSYQSALASLRAGTKKFNKMIQDYDAKVSVLENKMVTAANKAAAEVAPMVRTFLLSNLKSSGLKLGTSKDGSIPLSTMVASVQVGIVWRGLPNKPHGLDLKYQMPAGLPGNAYKKISSLNYGAVRTSKANRGLIGDKRKRSLKKALWQEASILTGIKSKRTNTWLAKAGIDVTKASFKGQSMRVGGFSATRAWKFFHLNEAQRKQVVAAFTVALTRELTGLPD